jgi:acyl-CoA dehydrogenase
MTTHYRYDASQADGLLWDHSPARRALLARFGLTPDQRSRVRGLFDELAAYCGGAYGEAGDASDAEGCRLAPDGRVVIPAAFHTLLPGFMDIHRRVLATPEGEPPLPPLLQYLLLEPLMGANPAFMTYLGFCGPSVRLLRRFGSPDQQARFIEPLETLRWASCLAITEPQAGSDISLIETTAQAQGGDLYHLAGEKRFISGGMHDLTENIVHFVLARTTTPGSGGGLSCFIVPRLRADPDTGALTDNHVRCVGLCEKMGFHGCVNANLSFGADGPCHAYLLGGRENQGLHQLMTLMSQARISTGVYALGLASSAYLNAVGYARGRVQGKSYAQSLNARAPSVPIIEHADVQRMLLTMKSSVEGCRSIVALLGEYETELLLAQGEPDQPASAERARRCQGLLNMMTPIVKAYCSDQAWRTCELAIQVHGGNGYLRDHYVERCARDVKVLSIWEGTNYIQSQFLIRDGLGLGLQSTVYRAFCEEIDAFILEAAGFEAETRPLAACLEAWKACVGRVAGWARTGRLVEIPKVSTRFLELTAELIVAWQLLRLATADASDAERASRMASARFFLANVLPLAHAKAQIILSETSSFDLDTAIFGGGAPTVASQAAPDPAASPPPKRELQPA